MVTNARSILHVDMNAFYVSVELRRRPELRGLPVVVGGTGGRGVVSAASYEARRFGVHSALSSAVARRLCPDAVFIHPDMDHYMEVSRQLRAIFGSFTPLVEQISVDEAFMDVTGAGALIGDAREVAVLLRRKVMEETELPCTVGIAANKFIAKMASEPGRDRPGARHLRGPARRRDLVHPSVAGAEPVGRGPEDQGEARHARHPNHR